MNASRKNIDYAFAFLLLVPLLLSTVGLYTQGIQISFRSFLLLAVRLAGFLFVLFYAQKRNLPRIFETARLCGWGVLFSHTYALPMYLVIRTSVPLQDALLYKMDHALGIHLDPIVALVRASHLLNTLSDQVYNSLPIALLFALTLLPLAGKTERAEQFLCAIILNFFATLFVNIFIQAIGPWMHASFTPSAHQSALEQEYHTLKSPSPFVLDPLNPGPLIALPSWHVILAVLSAASLWAIPLLRPITLLWGLGLVLSTLTTGWHYGVDVLAGLVFAIGSMKAAPSLHRRLCRGPTLPFANKVHNTLHRILKRDPH